MELKQGYLSLGNKYHNVLIVPFMELKQINLIIITGWLHVLIVPFMELKRFVIQGTDSGI